MQSVFLLISLTLPVGLFDSGKVMGAYATEAACEVHKANMQAMVIEGDTATERRYYCSKWSVTE